MTLTQRIDMPSPALCSPHTSPLLSHYFAIFLSPNGTQLRISSECSQVSPNPHLPILLPTFLQKRWMYQTHSSISCQSIFITIAHFVLGTSEPKSFQSHAASSPIPLHILYLAPPSPIPPHTSYLAPPSPIPSSYMLPLSPILPDYMSSPFSDYMTLPLHEGLTLP
jgi:hypothetical protein